MITTCFLHRILIIILPMILLSYMVTTNVLGSLELCTGQTNKMPVFASDSRESA